MPTTQPSFQPAPPPGAGWAAAPPHLPLPPPGTPAFPPAPPARTSGLAVVAVVLAALALVGTVVSALWFGGSGIEGSDDDGYGAWGPLTGQVAVVGGALPGDDLAAAVRREVEIDGGVVERMSCPDTAAVGQNVTTVCHAVVDDYEWAMVVFFEDAGGHYTILPV